MTAQRSKRSGKGIFSTLDAAKICGVSQQIIIRNFDSGALGGFRVPGSRYRRIPRNSLIAFMEANQIPLNRLKEFEGLPPVVVVLAGANDLADDVFGKQFEKVIVLTSPWRVGEALRVKNVTTVIVMPAFLKNHRRRDRIALANLIRKRGLEPYLYAKEGDGCFQPWPQTVSAAK